MRARRELARALSLLSVANVLFSHQLPLLGSKQN